MNSLINKYIGWNLLLGLTTGYAYAEGVFDTVLSDNLTTQWCAVLLLIFMFGQYRCVRFLRNQSPVNNKCARDTMSTLVACGFAGTLYGIILITNSLNSDSASDAQGALDTITLMQEGLGISLWTTFIAIIGRIWLRSNIRMIENSE